jgi:site-specific DNA recombinase
MSTCGNDSAAPAVLYAAKSTEDLRGSIGTQQADCRALAEREGLEVVAEFTDESVSAYSGDRGSGLVEAMATCEELGAERGEAALIIQHSDRLARGDGRQSKHLVEYALWALKHDVKIHSVQDPQTFGDLLYAVVTGQRNHEDSARKSAATRDGLKRRRDRGLPIGAVPEGYIVQAAIENGRPVTSRVVDEQRIPFVMRAMEMVESGSTFGDVSRRFNAEGLRTRRGKQWTTRAIREIVLNPDYTGTTGYPQVIDPERFERIVASVKRLDPVAVQARRKGRKAAEDYLLRGIASCGLCGSSLYTRRYKRVAGERAYICAAVREARGTCTAKPIPAIPVERAVIDDLDHFLADVEAWIQSRAEKADKDRDLFANAIGDQRAQLRTLNLRAEKARQQWERLLEQDDDAADAALRGAYRLEAEARHLEEAIAAAEGKLAEWPTTEVDAALDFYSDLRDAISGGVKAAKGFDDLRAALRSILARVDLHVDTDGVAVGVFELVGPDVAAGKVPMFVHSEEDRWAGDFLVGPDFEPAFLEVQRAAVANALATGAAVRAEPNARPWCRSSR